MTVTQRLCPLLEATAVVVDFVVVIVRIVIAFVVVNVAVVVNVIVVALFVVTGQIIFNCGWGVVWIVFFMSNPTTVLRLRLCCVVVGVVTIEMIESV